ncbi:efflux RND transporter periplasmic adaptor subunit [Roseimaritima sediminicola]|uniref:efflux RND transporter periplasmic adaptor subunit n=1 Tax=Roseimaritima sediminicola TaxID=2662066 RepID=UPI00129854EB|nr:efflux RND transporter periplasmic adaptor subunit [Roseimaritima sediminicola]
MAKSNWRIRGWIVPLLVLATLAIVVFWTFRPRPVLVDVAVVHRGPLDVRVEEDGRTRIRERYIVSSPLAGRLRRITWDVGDLVRAEQTVLAHLEPVPADLLDPRTAAQARARVRAAEERLKATKAERSKAEAAANFAEIEMGRVRRLREQNASSPSEMERKELEFQQRTEEARAASFGVDIASYELELQQAALLLTDLSSDDDSEMELAIEAPIDGRILRIYQESTAIVTAGAALLEVGDPSDLEVVVDVLSYDAVRIHPGDRVALRHWGGDQPLAGRVRLVEPSGFTKVSALGVEEQRVNVVVDFLDPAERRGGLGDGFRVDCEIVVWRESDVLQLPTSALFRIEGRWHVFAVQDGRAQLTEVRVGQNNGRMAQIRHGLDVGATVIVHPSDSVEKGVAVEARPPAGF